MTAKTYAAQTLIQRLLWEARCHRATPEEFEQLFHAAMERLEPGFMATAPHGRDGDRKTDGFDTRTGTVYQVYSPYAIGPAATARKIRGDLPGAVAYWNDRMQTWTFVYNARGGRPKPGVPTDVVGVLVEEAANYPSLQLTHLSDDDLWLRVRDELSPADRAEVLGDQYPEEWDGYIPPTGTPDQELAELSATRIVIIHDTIRPIDESAVYQALDPIRPFGRTIRLRPSVAELGWEGAAREQTHVIRQLLENAGESLARFAIFAISEIPLLIHLGYTLTDIVDLELFQYHRDDRTWEWRQEDRSSRTEEFLASGLPEEPIQAECEVVVRVSLSATIQADQSRTVTGTECVEVDLAVDNPSRDWLKDRNQVKALRRRFRQLLEQIAETVPHCRRIHLFYAGPAPGAVAIGQAINPRMSPPVQLYEFNRSASPSYESAVLLEQEEA